MDVNPVTTGSSSTSEGTLTRLADDFDSFLKLLTTQLTFQDPLDPIDSNEFMQQLVSFTGVEQAVKTNTNLESIIDLLGAGRASDAIGYLGTTVTAEGDAIELTGGEARVDYRLPNAASSTGILISNALGEVLFASEGETAAGPHSFVWDGLDFDGNAQPDGAYTVTVTAFDADDKPFSATTMVSGRVTRIETVDGHLVLTVNGAEVPLDDVISVEENAPQQL